MQSWIDLYLEYTRDTESPTSFHFWTAAFVVAGAVGRKVCLDFGFKVYPNLYVVLVAPPGRCRKTQAIRMGEDILRGVTGVNVSSDATTREALIRSLADCSLTSQAEDEGIITHCSLSLISTELSVFLGQKNVPMLSLLCELYDCKDVWEYKTKHSGKDTVYGVWFSMLGATTSEWLLTSLPVDAIGGGLASRVIFVVESERERRITRPSFDERLLDRLKAEIEDIASIRAGPASIEDSAFEFYNEWYQSLPEGGDDFSERKHLAVLKLALILALSYKRREITRPDIERAISEIERIEPRMPEALGGIGRSRLAVAINAILSALRNRGSISVEELMRNLWSDVTDDELDSAIEAVMKMGLAKMERDESNKLYVCKRSSHD